MKGCKERLSSWAVGWVCVIAGIAFAVMLVVVSDYCVRKIMATPTQQIGQASLTYVLMSALEQEEEVQRNWAIRTLAPPPDEHDRSTTQMTMTTERKSHATISPTMLQPQYDTARPAFQMLNKL